MNWDWHTITIYASKTKRSRVLPLTSSALAIVQRRKHQAKLFEGFDDDSLQRWCASLGNRASVPWGQRIAHGWTFHDLRRTSATVLESSGAVFGYQRNVENGG